jgi:hypothetical protein
MQHDTNVTALPEVSAPSISSCAVLLELSISEIRGSKIDKRATKEAMIQYNVQNPKDVQVTKNRFAGNKMLDAINKIVRVARTDLKAMTLAWGKMGHRIIPVAAIPQIAAHFSELENRYWELVLGHDVRAYDEQGLAYTKHEAGFLDSYEWGKVHDSAFDGLGMLYDQDDYPSVERMRGKFAWSLSFLPVPDTGHFVSEMIGEEFANIKNTFEDYHTNAIRSMSNDLWQRVHDIASTLSTQLDSNGGIHDRTLGNLFPLLDMLKDYNVTGDVHLEAVRQKLEDRFRGVGQFPLNKDALKDDPTLRAATKRTVDEVLASLPSLDL